MRSRDEDKTPEAQAEVKTAEEQHAPSLEDRVAALEKMMERVKALTGE